MRRKTTREFINELEIINPNIEVLGKYTTRRDKIVVKCKICGHEWSALPGNLLRGTGCPNCLRKTLTKSHEQFVEEVRLIHPEIEVIGEYAGAGERIEVRCKQCGYKWTPTAQSLISGTGCPSCYGNFKKTTDSFIKELEHISDAITVLGEYKNTHTPILVKCLNCGHEWLATPHNLLQGSGCIVCAGKKQKKQNEFVEELEKIDETIKVLGKYRATDTPVLVRCLNCGHEWLARPHNLLHGSGCPKCAAKKNADKSRKTQEQFEEELSSINQRIEVLGRYTNIGTPLLVRCKACGHEWLAAPQNLLLGSDCPNCLKYLRTSFPEQALYYYIKQVYSEAINGYKDIFPNNKMELDIYIPELQIGIEYDGAFWHRGKESHTREIKKYQKCKENGIRLIRIKEKIEKGDDAVSDVTIYAEESFDELTKRLREHIDLPDDIDISRDAGEIKAQYLPDHILLDTNYDRKPRTTQYFIGKLEQINPDVEVLNDYINTASKIKLKCKKCKHIWEARPNDLLKGHGCPKCAKKKTAIKNTKTQEQFISELSIKNPNIAVLGKYKNAKTKVLVKCKKCGNEWFATPGNLLRGHGCIECSPYTNRRKTNDQFLKEIQLKNPNIEPLEEYKGAWELMHVRCKKCGCVFKKAPSHLLRGTKCPNCKF